MQTDEHNYPQATPAFPEQAYDRPLDPTIQDEALPDRPDYGYGTGGRPDEPTELMSSEHEVAHMAWIIFTSDGPRYGEMVRLVGKSVLIGRDTECEVIIEDRTSSRQHAKIRIEGRDEEIRYILHDLATDNGTFVNGERIPQPTELNTGDIIRIGYTEMMFKSL